MAARIICIVLLFVPLSSCSTFGLIFDHLPSLTVWQMDRMFDLDDSQEEQLEQGAEQVHQWLKAEGLPTLVERLEGVVSLWTSDDHEQALKDLNVALDKSIAEFLVAVRPHLVPVFLTMTPQNAQAYRDYNEDKKEDWFAYALSSADKVESRIDRLEEWFGDLNSAQTREVAEIAILLPDELMIRIRNNDHWKERFLAAALAGEFSALNAWLADPSQWWLPEYRALRAENHAQRDALMVMMLSSMGEAQANHARDKVQTWVEDLKDVL